jgi:BA14K-like protein
MLAKTIALATALVLGVAAAAVANDNDPNGGSRTFGNGGYATSGVNPAFHARSAAVCAKTYKSYDPSDMTYLGKDGKRHPC